MNIGRVTTMRATQRLATLRSAVGANCLGAVAVAAMLSLTVPTPLGAQSLACTPLGNNSSSAGSCSPFASCKFPNVPDLVYQLDVPGCDFMSGSCAYTATTTVEFPGNRFNFCDPGIGSQWGHLLLNTFSCLTCQDLMLATIQGTFQCGVASTATLQARMCQSTECEKLTPKPIDAAGYFCPHPPPDDCATNTNECRDCRPTGGGCSVSVDGIPSCTFPASGAHLRYRAGGAGGQGFPGTTGTLPWADRLGLYLAHDYAQRIVTDPVDGINRVWLITEGASFREFKSPAAGSGLRLYDVTKNAPSDEYRRLYYCSDATCGSGIPSGGWLLDYLDGRRDAFRPDGQWLSTTWAKDPSHPKLATYTGNQLTEVSFPDGRKEKFEYTGTKLTKLTEVGVGADCALQPLDCRSWTFGWNGNNELTQVVRPGGTAWELTYDPSKNGGRLGYLTQIRLLSGTFGRVENAFEYNSAGRVFRSWRGDPSFTGPGAIDKQEYSYTNPTLPSATTVTEWISNSPLTTVTSTYNLARDSRSIKPKVTSMTGSCPACGLSPNTTFTYGDSAHPLRSTLVKNARLFDTVYSYNAFGRTLTKTEANGTADQRTTNYEYGESQFPSLLTAIQLPSTTTGNRRTEMNYNNTTGALDSRTIKGNEAGGPAVFSTSGLVTIFTMNTSGEVLTSNPPDDGSYGTTDQTTFAYALANRNGHVATSRTDPLGLTTQFGYDAFNRRTSVIDPNLVETTTSYDSLHRVTEVRRKGTLSPGDDLVTKYFYDCPGGGPGTEPPEDNPPACRDFQDLRCVQMPKGNATEYRYDSRGRLTAITKKADCNVATQPQERTLYTLDVAGNRTMEQLQRWSGAAWVTESKTEFVYTTKCHVDKIVRGKGETYESTTEFCYDENNNLKKTWDANHPSATFPLGYTRHAYDARDRLVRVTQPWGPTAAACDPENGADVDCATTLYEYDVQDHLKKVTDAESNATTYETSDRDLMTKETSPVFSGGANFRTMVYNEHGQLKSETDPRGITVNRTLDAFDRVTLIDHSDNSLDTSFTYDGSAALFQKGRLITINRGAGASIIGYVYDRFGRMTQDGALEYRYDKNGNRTELRYGDNTTACYSYDFADRQSALSFSTIGGSTPCASGLTTLVSSATYYPSGPLKTAALGNGIAETRLFDKRYFPTSIVTTGGAPTNLSWAYTTDKLGNPTLLDDQLSSPDRVYTYQDHQYFLLSGNGPWGNQSWTYDRIGNRKTETDSTTPATLNYGYVLNPSGKNTPKLLTISPAPGNSATGQWTYGYDAAGNQTTITASGGELFGTDTLGYSAESKLASLGTSYGTATAAMLYDGRGFLRQSLLSYPPTAENVNSLKAIPTYSSDGTLFRRVSVRKRTFTNPDTGMSNTTGAFTKSTNIFYFAGRPLALGTTYSDGGPGVGQLYLTTDHLGTPVLATNSSAEKDWIGGFEPFGEAYTFFGDNEMFLRFPGQWDDPSWHTSGRVADTYYNVNRWYDSGTGRYERPDPLAFLINRTFSSRAGLYGFAGSNPLFFVDVLGLASEPCCDCPEELWSYSGVSNGGGVLIGWTNFHGTFSCRSKALEVQVDGTCWSGGMQAFLTGAQWDFSGGPLLPAIKACKVEDLFGTEISIGAQYGPFGVQGDPGAYSPAPATGTFNLGIGVGGGVALQRCTTKPYKPLVQLPYRP